MKSVKKQKDEPFPESMIQLIEQLWDMDIPAQLKIHKESNKGYILLPEAELNINFPEEDPEFDIKEFRKNIMNLHKNSNLNVPKKFIKKNKKTVATYIHSIYQNRIFSHNNGFPIYRK